MKVNQAYHQSQELSKQVQLKQQEINAKIKELEHKAKMLGISDLSTLDSMSNASGSKPEQKGSN